jgi:hypothetical protein
LRGEAFTAPFHDKRRLAQHRLTFCRCARMRHSLRHSSARS